MSVILHSKKDKQDIHLVHQAEADAKVWDRFDIFYGFFVVANGIVMGLRADKIAEDAQTLWTLVDALFFIILQTAISYKNRSKKYLKSAQKVSLKC